VLGFKLTLALTTVVKIVNGLWANFRHRSFEHTLYFASQRVSKERSLARLPLWILTYCSEAAEKQRKKKGVLSVIDRAELCLMLWIWNEAAVEPERISWPLGCSCASDEDEPCHVSHRQNPEYRNCLDDCILQRLLAQSML
jgi:hypothetical protein